MNTFAPIKNMSQRPIFKTNKPKRLNFDSDEDEEYVLTDEEYFSEENDDDYDEKWDCYKRLWESRHSPPKIDMLDYSLNIVGYELIQDNWVNISWNEYNNLWKKDIPNLTKLGDALRYAGYSIVLLN